MYEIKEFRVAFRVSRTEDHMEMGFYRTTVQTAAAVAKGNFDSCPRSPLVLFSHNTSVRYSLHELEQSVQMGALCDH